MPSSKGKKKKTTSRRIPGYFLLLVGLSIGLVFSAFALWVNLEGMSFWGYPESISTNPDLRVEAEISRLNCPVLLAEGETDVISVMVSNPYDRATRAYVKAHISMPDRLENMVRRTRSASLAPGEETEFRWQISSENTIFDHVILARVFLKLTEGHPPARTQHCGIMSVNLWGLSSNLILVLVVGSSLSFMLVGAYILWLARSRDVKKKNLALKVTLMIGALTMISLVSILFRTWEIILIALAFVPVILFSAISYHFGRMDSQYN